MFEQTNLLGASNSNRLELFKTKNELAKNFYDDPDFCPIASSEEVTKNMQRRKMDTQTTANITGERASTTHPATDVSANLTVDLPAAVIRKTHYTHHRSI